MRVLVVDHHDSYTWNLVHLVAGVTGDVPEVVVAGMLGPRGDGYVAGEAMHPEQARDYHLPQVRVLADAGARVITALTLTTAEEAVGIVLAALLFGALYQGGAELAFEIQGFSRDMVFTLQGLIVLFAGAMAQVAAPWLAAAYQRLRRAPVPAKAAEAAHG